MFALLRFDLHLLGRVCLILFSPFVTAMQQDGVLGRTPGSLDWKVWDSL